MTNYEASDADKERAAGTLRVVDQIESQLKGGDEYEIEDAREKIGELVEIFTAQELRICLYGFKRISEVATKGINAFNEDDGTLQFDLLDDPVGIDEETDLRALRFTRRVEALVAVFDKGQADGRWGNTENRDVQLDCLAAAEIVKKHFGEE